MTIDEFDLEPCPVCQSKAKWTLSPAGTRRRSRMEYGILCSNGKCSWSYACATYRSRDEAANRWNKKCQERKILDMESERLNPCTCGGKARLIYERWGGAEGWFVRCETCGKLLSATKYREAIIEAWNRENGEENGAQSN